MSGQLPLSQSLFWDTNPDNLDMEKHARYIISRVVNFGQIEDWRLIKSFYGLERIKEEMLRSLDLMPKSLSFLSLALGAPVEDFLCYTRIQLQKQHWSD